MKLLITAIPPDDFQRFLVEERRKQLDDFSAFARKAGIPNETKVLLGNPSIEIIREVLRNEHDLVMMIANGQSKLEKLFLGSMTMRLLRKCPCPVWVIKPQKFKPYTSILAAVDVEPRDEEPTHLNTKILDLAVSLARADHSELHIVHAWNLFGEAALRSPQHGMPDIEVDKLVQESQALHENWLDDLLESYSLKDVKHRVHLAQGKAAEVIPELAANIRADVIVMGTVGRIGLAGFFIGNTAETVLSQVNCSVLAVKPDNFVTPVKLK